jgi:hypothetical protein
MIIASVEAEQLAEQLRRLEGFPRITERHLRPAMDDSLPMILTAWRAVIPFRTGAYISGIVGRVESVTGTTATALVETNVGAEGFPYPARLEYSGRYHFASSSMPTRGRVKAGIKQVFPAVIQRFLRAVDDILEDMAVN